MSTKAERRKAIESQIEELVQERLSLDAKLKSNYEPFDNDIECLIQMRKMKSEVQAELERTAQRHKREGMNAVNSAGGTIIPTGGRPEASSKYTCHVCTICTPHDYPHDPEECSFTPGLDVFWADRKLYREKEAALKEAKLRDEQIAEAVKSKMTDAEISTLINEAGK